MTKYPNSITMPNRKARKAERSKVFQANKRLKKDSKRAKISN